LAAAHEGDGAADAENRFPLILPRPLAGQQRPVLSGIVLSLVDERGEPQDGFLRLHEICGMNLRADLVVLSACGTALASRWRPMAPASGSYTVVRAPSRTVHNGMPR